MVNRRDVALRVCALGFDTRSYTALQLFFRGKCGDRATLVGDDGANVGIIDMDSFNAAKILADQRERHPERVLILLSLERHEESLPNAIYIKKPVQIQNMLTALDEASERLAPASSPGPRFGFQPPKPEPPKRVEPPPTAKVEPSESKVDLKPKAELKPESPPPQPFKKTITVREENKTANQAATLLDERGFGDYIGSLKDIDPSNPIEVKAAQYDPKRYLQGYLQSACKTAVAKNCALRLNTGWKPITIFPQSREIWVDANDQQLRSFCLVPAHSIADQDFADSGTSVMTISPASAIRMKGDDFDPTQLQRMDALIWKVALWTSAGRVPDDIDLNRPVYLRHWPNFTRLLMFPNAMRIAALLSEQPRSLLDVAETLDIRQQYVFAFFSAARALGLADQATRQSENLIAPPTLEPKKNVGVLKKILQRLLGR
ncbi:hypothetical protein [Methylomagnum sp.]